MISDDIYVGFAMNESSMESCRKDEWSELLLLVMRTSLSVAHELGLPPDTTLDCAARHLHFHDFAWFASAMQGASRAHACCGQSGNISAVEVAYIKTLAARLKSNRNVLAGVPTIYAYDLQVHVDAPAQAYEKVAEAIRALKGDVRRAFSQIRVSDDAALQGASGFAMALAAIMSVEGKAAAYERALAAVLHVRSAVDRHVADGDADNGERHRSFDGHKTHEQRPVAPDGWVQRVKDAIYHPNRLHK
jgi:hypothetical protein